MPLICFDWDDTVSADVPTFRRVICHFINAGWQCVICTGRNDSPGNRADIEGGIRGIDIPIVFAGATPKREAMRAAGYGGKLIAVDDCPEMWGSVPLLGGGK